MKTTVHLKRVACVDDNVLVLKVLEWYLKSRGYVILPCSSGRRALELVSKETVDAVVIDYQMPEMNGDEVAAAIRSLYPRIPIIMFSGFGEIPQKVMALVDNFVQKGQPDDFAAVGDCLDSLLVNRDAEQKRLRWHPSRRSSRRGVKAA